MITVRDLLRDADPLRHEPAGAAARDRAREAMKSAASIPSTERGRLGRRAALVAVAIGVVGAGLAGTKLWTASPTVHAAAVRFEIRLAESTPTLGLQPSHVAGSDRVIYLHPEAIVTNDDIAAARVVAGNAPDQFHVAVTLTSSAGEKMRAATADHIGRPVALLVDGEVISAPTVRSAIGAEALITGNFSRGDADRIANGMLLR